MIHIADEGDRTLEAHQRLMHAPYMSCPGTKPVSGNVRSPPHLRSRLFGAARYDAEIPPLTSDKLL